jgi:hypothetical protein
MRITFAACLFLIVSACVSDERASREWDRFVAAHDDCETADDCALVYGSCPLPCHSSVAAEHVDEAEEKADSLVRRAERFGGSCAHKCGPAPPVVCDSGRCTPGEAPPTS